MKGEEVHLNVMLVGQMKNKKLFFFLYFYFLFWLIKHNMQISLLILFC